MHIRQAIRTDLENLLDLYRHLMPEDRRPSKTRAETVFDAFLKYDGSCIVLGEIDDQLVASCTLVVVPNLTRGGTPYGLIENAVTHTDFRRRGLGKMILDAATEHAWQNNCYKIMLLTGSNRSDAINFYHQAGFDQTKTGFQKRRIPPRSGL
ncbi:GNAT family N-acetyltransferase [Parasulfitobacter algicola]|uniref:GNAT family N-acetyltransferase n=1 Tax=Parasulfitobacter algicola TaxID=2614809 RepID=A0ABX2IMP8_9RHOB|nr:GNAT family N-acetyltransferase [Sulfitobacter algicola]